MLNGCRVETHQLRDVGQLLVILLHSLHLELDLKVYYSLVEVFRQTPRYILLLTFLIRSLYLPLSLQTHLLFFIVLLLGLLLLSMVSGACRKILLPILLVVLILGNVEPNWLL